MIDLKYLSKISNINLTSSEERLFKKQIQNIINYVNEINTIPISNKNDENNQPQTISESNDMIEESLNVEDVLKNTDSKYNDYFKVKLILKNKIIKNK